MMLYENRPISVSTVDELKQAVEQKQKQIIVTAQLASDLKKADILMKCGAGTVDAAAAAFPETLATGGASNAALCLAAASIAVKVTVDVAAIIAAVFIGIGLLIALYKNYDVKWDYPGGSGTFTRNGSN